MPVCICVCTPCRKNHKVLVHGTLQPGQEVSYMTRKRHEAADNAVTTTQPLPLSQPSLELEPSGDVDGISSDLNDRLNEGV